MNTLLRNALAVVGMAFATQAAAQVTFYEHENFDGRSFTAQQRIDNLERNGFNDRASSVVVIRDQWEVCEHAQFGGECAILRPGRYPSLASMGLNDRVSSLRAVSTDARIDARIEDHRYAPAPVGAQVTFYENEGLRGRSFTTQEQGIAETNVDARTNRCLHRLGDRLHRGNRDQSLGWGQHGDRRRCGGLDGNRRRRLLRDGLGRGGFCRWGGRIG